MNIDKADFYYGAVVLNILADKQKREIELLDIPYSHQFIKYSKNGITHLVFMKYKSSSQTASHHSVWHYSFSNKECEILHKITSEHHYDSADVILICGEFELQDSHICIIKEQDINLIITEQKAKVTLVEGNLSCHIGTNDIHLSASLS